MRLTGEFFRRDVLEAAPDLVGKLIVRKLPDGTLLKARITETEAYRGQEDKACHASKGRTKRTELLFGQSGVYYVYLCYGIHWLMNVVTGEPGQPQGILIRCCQGYEGPARLTKYLQVDSSFNGVPLDGCEDLWFEDDGFKPGITTAPRVGIDYAGEPWKSKPWRFIAERSGS